VGIIGYAAYPIAMETLMNLYSYLTFNDITYIQELTKKEINLHKLQYPIVYSEGYNIKVFGIEKIHPFDCQKYGKIYDLLVEKKIIIDESNIHCPNSISRGLLSMTHAKLYLFKICYSIYLNKIFEVPIFFIPAPFLRWKVLEPMLLQTQGTIDAGLMALDKKWAINLGGGFHHASYDEGAGFCVYADISLCVTHLKRYHSDKVKKVMIIDLDAHQGNGHERDFLDDPDVFIVDSYNPDLYPFDFPARKSIMVDIPVFSYDDDQAYIDRIGMNLQTIVEQFDKYKPDFIIYNAGVDILEFDPLGMLNITKNGVIERDEMVFEFALRNRIPILMVLSGGYHANNVNVIVESIGNIIKKFSLL